MDNERVASGILIYIHRTNEISTSGWRRYTLVLRHHEKAFFSFFPPGKSPDEYRGKLVDIYYYSDPWGQSEIRFHYENLKLSKETEDKDDYSL